MRILTFPIAALLLTSLMAGPSLADPPRAQRSDRLASCSWDSPGHNPFMGDVVAAVDRYGDIPAPVRATLKRRMQARQYDDIAAIRRDSIAGERSYEPQIRDMHFGPGRVCATVTRDRWTAQMSERGLVYCEGEHCILVPTVCRNVSRITRKPTLVAGAPQITPDDPLLVDAPGAGPIDLASSRTAVVPITSSFAEAVAGATLPLWSAPAPGEPDGLPGASGAGADGPVGETAALLDVPWAWPPAAVGGPGGPGGGSGPGGNSGGGSGGGDGNPDGSIGGNTGGMIDGGGGGGGIVPGPVPDFTGGGVVMTPVPEPSTWVSLLLGLACLAWIQRRTGAPRCATQKRS